MLAPLLIPFAAIVLLAFVAWTRELRIDFSDSFLPALAVGVIAGITSSVLHNQATWNSWTLPLLLVAGCVILRWRHVDEDYVDGILAGTLAGASAALFVGLQAGPAASTYALLAGAVAGLATHIVLFRFRMFGVIAGFAAAAILATVRASVESGLATVDWRAPFFALAAITLVSLLLTFFQLSRLTKELEEESRLGVIAPDQVATIANPWRRLRMQGWQDRGARHEFVRVSTELANRKLRQRRMPPATARLYQLEILKLRQVVQEVFSVELSVRESNRSAQSSTDASDRMPSERVTNTE